MRSPDPLLVQRWLLQPRPTGRRRIAAAYLAASAGVAVTTVIIAASNHLSTSCSSLGFSCLGEYFRGVLLAILVGVGVALTISFAVKLGAAFWLALLGAIPLIALIGLALAHGPIAFLAVPVMIIIAVATPAAAAWTSARLT